MGMVNLIRPPRRASTEGESKAAEMTFSPGYLSMSVGFFFRFNGAKINSSPRDLVAMIDSGGGFQYLQLNDTTPST